VPRRWQFGRLRAVRVPLAMDRGLLDQGNVQAGDVSNNAGVGTGGGGDRARCCSTAPHPSAPSASMSGQNKEVRPAVPGRELEVELTPQGTLAERASAPVGAGIRPSTQRAGVGTVGRDGGLPWRYEAAEPVALASPPKEGRGVRRRPGGRVLNGASLRLRTRAADRARSPGKVL